ncbi:hypothetical protein OF83DRAFT_1138058 [Amylostereum chailletii]|nr:hypothetical protein OF83DRAFT_1138058 [Amylostereum chailletii]
MSHTRINPALDFDSQNDTPSPLAQTPVSQTPASESTPSAAPPPAPAGQDDYPPQLHAGKVGYGPSYGRGVGMGEKIAGVKEEVVGKVLRKPETVEHGHLRRTGELKRQEQDAKVGLSGCSRPPFTWGSSDDPVHRTAPPSATRRSRSSRRHPQHRSARAPIRATRSARARMCVWSKPRAIVVVCNVRGRRGWSVAL